MYMVLKRKRVENGIYIPAEQTFQNKGMKNFRLRKKKSIE